MSSTIEAFGSTSLVEDGSFYFLYPTGGPAIQLSYIGAPVVAGQFGQWVPIGAEQTATGYEVAWKVTGSDQYAVWATDGNGNFVSSALDPVSGTNPTLESFEASFHQDLNGDGVIGPPPPSSTTVPPATTVVVEGFGATSLTEVGTNFYLYDGSGVGPSLKYQGADVGAGQFGQWTPIGAEQTASGYEVAWKVTGSDEYRVWITDSNGNYASTAFANVSGTSAALQSIETSFHQDLNGDGSIGPAGAVSSSPQFVYEGVDSSGAQIYDVTWDALGSHPFAVRVLTPDHPSTTFQHSFLYALPVEGGLAQSTWGSGLDELHQLNVQNQYDATIIEPIFPVDPWYADNVADATMNFETFMATYLPAWADSNFSTSGGTEENLLIGFSKSGNGALDLMFKHPDVFNAVAAWDFPADMATYTDYGASDNYGTDANFQANYRLTSTFIDTWKAPFTSEDRIWISGGDLFQNQVSDFDTLLTSHGVLHTLSPPISDAHNWYGGWLSSAVAGLYGLVENGFQGPPTVLDGHTGGQTLTASGPSTLIGGPNDILNGGAGADTFVFLQNFGANKVNNFTPSVDTLEFSQSVFANTATVLGLAQQVGTDVVITQDANDVVTLHNVQLANLHATDFHLV